MDPITLSLLMAGGQALLPAIKSMKQGQTLKNLPDVERPDFQIPEAATEQLGIARSIAGNRNMPGYDEAIDKIENQTNRAIGDVRAAGGNMQDIMAAMAAANVGASMQKRDLDITNDRSYLGSLQNLQTQLGQYAAQENLKQQDEMKKYTDEMARRAGLDTARQQNMQNAVGSVAQGAATGIGYQMNMDMLNKIYPGAAGAGAVQQQPMQELRSLEAGPLAMPAAGVGIAPQLNQPLVSAQNPSAQKVMSANPFNGTQLMPNLPLNQPATTALGITRPDLLPENRAASLDMSMQPGSGVVLPGLDPNVIAANGGAGVLAPQFTTGQPSENQPYVSGVLYNNPTQPTVSAPQQQQFQTPFNMLTPDQQQKRILELMLSGVIK